MSALKNIIQIAVFMTAINTPQSFAQQYYKWVDSKGITNYSARPPANSVKKKKISTISTYADGSRYQAPQRQFSSNSAIADTQYNYYSNNTSSNYNTPPARSEADEALRQKVIKDASTVIPGARGLTAKQRSVLAQESGGGASNNSNNSYSAPMPQRQPSTITNCDSAGCWGTDGTRYNRAAGNTYFPTTGGVCQNVGGQMQCN